ncbi:nucleotidyltransferase family protein [Pseudocolwellia sp. AS88]|uniref:nucleotidyltransferase family protein n=1 Tax=Pseudocolwellia sp. AS88 TaxID=3063958 RepID=UPI0026E9DF00|nr:nucleotidyltransferase family protein [Pseudocolwellia sp. AS88]MDO7083982.1 nucleotidyltransferase family protein [Pseudocolwellia sp. AS88]
MSNSDYNLKIILLAAGKSQRFNGIKLLSTLSSRQTLTTSPKKQSTTLIEHVLNQLNNALQALKIADDNLLIATGTYHQQLSALISERHGIHYCENAHLGLGHTIAQSVSEILEVQSSAKPSHIMITLADQVALTTDDYIHLIEQSLSTPNKLVCAQAEKELMPPAIFPQHYFKELATLHGDKGAKALLHKNKDNLQPVLLNRAVIDIDTQQDLIDWLGK